MKVGIIGAGMAGLACAARLDLLGIETVLFDKGRRPGGRLSTLRIDDKAWDFGTPYIRSGHGEFAAQVSAWRQAGLLAPWPGGPVGALVGVPRMSSLVEAQSTGRDVRFGERVERIDRDHTAWFVSGPDLSEGPFDALIAAIPCEQAAVLLALHDLDMAREAASARSWACWTVMAAFPARLEQLPDFIADRGDLAWACRDSSKPGRGQSECWVIQAGPQWSKDNLECDPADVAQRLLARFGLEAGIDLPAPTFLKAHRWRFSEPLGQHGRALWNPRLRLGACGDWCMAPRVEGAWRSGTELADWIGADLREADPARRRALSTA